VEPSDVRLVEGRRYYTAAHAASLLGVTRSAVIKRCQRRSLPHVAPKTAGNPTNTYLVDAGTVDYEINREAFERHDPLRWQTEMAEAEAREARAEAAKLREAHLEADLQAAHARIEVLTRELAVTRQELADVHAARARALGSYSPPAP
jgi:hypothetical protein